LLQTVTQYVSVDQAPLDAVPVFAQVVLYLPQPCAGHILDAPHVPVVPVVLYMLIAVYLVQILM
jgi:hypothetical protein